MVLSKLKKYTLNVLISLDQLLNTLLIGDPDETISSRAAKRRDTCRWCNILCTVLDWVDTDHCKKSIEEDEGSDAL